MKAIVETPEERLRHGPSIGVYAEGDRRAGPRYDLNGAYSWEANEEALPTVDPNYVVVVIPAYNEERFIASVVINCLHAVRKVIVVDDGSTDRTARLARLAGAEVLSLPQNQGKAAALTIGFHRALEMSPAVVVTLDADTQHDPAEIPILAEPILNGTADIVIGSRFIGDKRRRIPGWRKMGQHALTAVTNLTSGVAITDSQSGYRSFSNEALRQLRFESKGLAFESEMQFQVEGTGLRLMEVPISVHYLDGNKRNPVVHGLQVLEVILGMVTRRRPLLFLGFPGVLMMVGGMLAGLWVVDIVDTKHVVPVGTSVLTALLLISGLLLVASALILNTIEHFMERMQGEVRGAVDSIRIAVITREGPPGPPPPMTSFPGRDEPMVAMLHRDE